MKAVFVIVFLTLCATVALGWKGQCPPDLKCRASASTRIVIRGPGKCKARSKSFCAVTAFATRNCIAVDKKYRQIGCRGHYDVEAEASCFAAAAVKAFTAAKAEVNCEGKKVYGCAHAQANARAIACSVARAIVRVSVVFKEDRQSKCDVAVDAMITALVKAATYSSAGVCVSGTEYLADKDHDYAAAFKKIYADALGECWAFCSKSKKIVPIKPPGGRPTKAAVHSEKKKVQSSGHGETGGFGGSFASGDNAHSFSGFGH